MSASDGRFNPFPGLRPFEPDEDHLFFGREKEIDELLRRLRTTRLVSVVGTSGSGKSSLVRSGLIPSLYSGFLVAAGSTWRVAMMRPGEDPVGHLAQAVSAPEVLGVDPELASTNRVLTEATLRRGSLGLVDAVRQSSIPPDTNILVVVDQFEELFRFRRSRQVEHSRDEAVAFVKLLLEAAAQEECPIYIVLTMRSDFIGDCMEYPGLPEAVNAGQYLVRRMTRSELRSAITGPVAVGGGTIAPRLVNRVLNDLGDDPDQLPLLQHALMRTWDHWEQAGDGPIDIAHYEAIGTLHNALSMHAEEAYQEASSPRGQEIARQVFKALTDTVSDQRGVRRPTAIAELAAICEVPDQEVIAVVEIFRRAGRSFLMPPAAVPLGSRSIIDLSHESLMRCWTRLIAWAEEERASATFYFRLSQAAAWFAEGAAGLWRNPELQLAQRWKSDARPTSAWARRYDPHFERAMEFLARSTQERDRLDAEQERERKRTLRATQWAAAVLSVLLLVALAAAYVAWRESTRAETNLRLAREAVDETLASADRDPARVAADFAEMETFRRELLQRTERFYLAFMKQEPSSLEVRQDLALAHFRLGHISRMLERPLEAVEQYQNTIGQFQALVREYPAEPRYRQGLADAFNWMGETLRPLAGRSGEAEGAYNAAWELQSALVRDHPADLAYRQELARTLYNRGILRAAGAQPADGRWSLADRDFREAIDALEQVVAGGGPKLASQELARVLNNQASLMAQDDTRLGVARALYERAIGIDEALLADDPRNREYALELAKFCSNFADLLRESGEAELARQRNAQAQRLIENLARPAPSLGVELADVHTLRGTILEADDRAGAMRAYETATGLFAALAGDRETHRLPIFHLRYGDLLLNLARVARAEPRQGGDLLAEATATYLGLGEEMVGVDVGTAEVRNVLQHVAGALPSVPAGRRGELTRRYQELQRRFEADQGRPQPSQ